MPSDLLPIFVALALLIAFIVAARGWLLFNTIQQAADDVHQRRLALVERNSRLRQDHARLTTQLAEANSELERALWSLPRFDERAAAAETALRERRAVIERVRVRYLEGGRRGLARVRRTVTLLEQLQQLRRMFLG